MYCAFVTNKIWKPTEGNNLYFLTNSPPSNFLNSTRTTGKEEDVHRHQPWAAASVSSSTSSWKQHWTPSVQYKSAQLDAQKKHVRQRTSRSFWRGATWPTWCFPVRVAFMASTTYPFATTPNVSDKQRSLWINSSLGGKSGWEAGAWWWTLGNHFPQHLLQRRTSPPTLLLVFFNWPLDHHRLASHIPQWPHDDQCVRVCALTGGVCVCVYARISEDKSGYSNRNLLKHYQFKSILS